MPDMPSMWQQPLKLAWDHSVWLSGLLHLRIVSTWHINVIHFHKLLVLLVPTAPPQNVGGSALSSSAIMLVWSPPPPLEVNGVIRHYTVEIVERHTTRQWTFLAVSPSLHIGSLHPYYYYDVNVSATTVGMGPSSSVYSIRTLPEGMFNC